jgi:hypothetical protein
LAEMTGKNKAKEFSSAQNLEVPLLSPTPMKRPPRNHQVTKMALNDCLIVRVPLQYQYLTPDISLYHL